MKATDVLMIVAVLAVLLAGANLMITINKIDDYKVLSGFAFDEGTANLTITSNAQVNFTTDNVDWGSGYVGIGDTSCELTTTGTNNCTNFNTINTGLILENIGNEDVSLNLSSSKTAAQFIGGVSPDFEWNVTENDTADACAPPGIQITAWEDISTGAITQACANFTALDSADELLVDLRVVIPSTGVTAEAKGVTITATAFAIV